MRAILQPGRNCWAVEPIVTAGLLIDGQDYFRAFYQAARTAQRYLLIAGWQFDSQTKLLVGSDADAVPGAVAFLPFLEELCVRNRQLQIYILAWDFNIFLALKREFMQDSLFNSSASDRVHYRFDATHPVGASHHQKFAVIDGHLGFAGGLDICQGRWDTRAHQPGNLLRIDEEGGSLELHHDIQGYVAGPAAQRLTELFQLRWERAGGSRLELPEPVATRPAIAATVRIVAKQAGWSRTQPRLLVPEVEPIQEIRALYLDAIATAERLIYIENQYFSSPVVYEALVNRLRAVRRRRLQIVIIVPKHMPGWLEEMSMGIPQAKMLKALRHVADETGHDLGLYYTIRPTAGGEEQPVFIHSKLLIIDDRFLMVGSANTNNRSMGLDTELNVSWEATSHRQWRLIRSIRRARINLLAEHVGLQRSLERPRLWRIRGLVRRLDRLAKKPKLFLRAHPLMTLFDQSQWLQWLTPNDINVDPEKPIVEETVYEAISREPNSFFARGFTAWRDWLENR